jgi:hypothetical protein
MEIFYQTLNAMNPVTERLNTEHLLTFGAFLAMFILFLCELNRTNTPP